MGSPVGPRGDLDRAEGVALRPGRPARRHRLLSTSRGAGIAIVAAIGAALLLGPPAARAAESAPAKPAAEGRSTASEETRAADGAGSAGESSALLPLARYVESYYRSTAQGRPPPAAAAEAEIARLIAAAGRRRGLATISHAGREPGEDTTPFLSVVVAEGFVRRIAVEIEDETIIEDVYVYWDPLIPDFLEALGRPRAGWADLRGDRLFINRGYILDNAAPYLRSAADASDARLPNGLTPGVLRRRPEWSLPLADVAYARDAGRPFPQGTLVERIEHETILHESQHLFDRRNNPGMAPEVLEYRAMLRGLMEGEIPYANVGRLAVAAVQPEGSPYRKAALALLADLVRLSVERRPEATGVEDLLDLSPEEIREAARRLYPASAGRFWFR